MGVKIKGLQEVTRKFADVGTRYRDAHAAALYQEGLDLHADSILQCPVDTGTLRRSAYVAPPESLDNPRVRVGYGTTYALPVHERTEVKHPVGKAHFLRDPYNARQQNYAARLADRTVRNVRDKVALGRVKSTAPTGPNDG